MLQQPKKVFAIIGVMKVFNLEDFIFIDINSAKSETALLVETLSGALDGENEDQVAFFLNTIVKVFSVNFDYIYPV